MRNMIFYRIFNRFVFIYLVFFLRSRTLFFLFSFYFCAQHIFYVTKRMWNSIMCSRWGTKCIWYAWLALQMQIDAVNKATTTITKTSGNLKRKFKYNPSNERMTTIYTEPQNKYSRTSCMVYLRVNIAKFVSIFWSNLCLHTHTHQTWESHWETHSRTTNQMPTCINVKTVEFTVIVFDVHGDDYTQQPTTTPPPPPPYNGAWILTYVRLMITCLECLEFDWDTKPQWKRITIAVVRTHSVEMKEIFVCARTEVDMDLVDSSSSCFAHKYRSRSSTPPYVGSHRRGVRVCMCVSFTTRE